MKGILSIAVTGESFMFFDPRTLKWRPFEIFAKLNGKNILFADFAKFAEYQILIFWNAYLKCISSPKLLLLINEWIFENFSYRFDGSSKMSLFYFSLFDFDDFLAIFAKNFMKRPPVFMIDMKSSYKLLLSQKYLKSRNF